MLEKYMNESTERIMKARASTCNVSLVTNLPQGIMISGPSIIVIFKYQVTKTSLKCLFHSAANLRIKTTAFKKISLAVFELKLLTHTK